MGLFSAKLASLFVDIVVNSRRANTVLYQFNSNVRKSGQQVSLFRQQLLALGLASSAILLVMKAAHLLSSAFQAVLETTARLEKNFLEVQKNLQLSAEGFAYLQDETLKFATNVAGIDLNKFQQILITSSRMGLEGKENLLEFSKAVAMIQLVSEGVSESDLAEFLYRISELFKRSTDSAIYLGNTLVTLSNAFATNEQQIIKVTEKLMGSAEVLGLTAEETLAVAAAVRSMGITAERASSGMARVFQIMASDPLGTGRTLFEGNEQAAIDFAKTVENEPTKALLILFERLKAISNSGADLQAVLKALDLEDRRVAETIKIVFNRLDDLKKGFDLAGESTNNINSLMTKFGTVSESLDAKLIRLTSNWEAFKKSLGNTEAFKGIIDELAGVLKILTDIQNSGALKTFMPFLNALDRTAAELKIVHEMFGNRDIKPIIPETGRGTSQGGGASGEWGEDASRTEEQLKQEKLDREKEQADTAEKLNAKNAEERARRVEDEYERERQLILLNAQEESKHLDALLAEKKLSAEQWANFQEQLVEQTRQDLDDSIRKQHEEEMDAIADERDARAEAAQERKEWEADLLRDKINNDRKVWEANRQIRLDEAALEEDFRRNLGEFVLTDREQQAEALKRKFAELKEQAANMGRPDLFPALDQQLKIELGEIGKPEARFSGLQDVWKNAQLEFLKTPKEEIQILKDIAKNTREGADAARNNKPVAAVGP